MPAMDAAAARHATAQAMLALVGATHVHAQEAAPTLQRSPTATTPTATTPTATTPTSERQRVVNTSRERKKQELLALRRESAELEWRLRELQVAANRSVASSGDGADASGGGAAAHLTAAWKTLAMGQYEQRRRAEAENAQLRALLDEQVKAAQAFERYLHKRRKCEAFPPAPMSKHAASPSARSPFASATVFDELEASISAAYEHVCGVLNRPTRPTDCSSLRETHSRHSDRIGAYVESTDNRVLPFNVRDAADAVWRYYLHHPVNADKSEVKTTSGSPDLIARDVSNVVNFSRYNGVLPTKFAARRFVEARRVVFVWAALSDPRDMFESSMDGLLLRYTGWTVVQAWDPDASSGQDMTLCRSVHVGVPEAYESVHDQRRKIDNLFNFALQTMDLQIDLMHQSVDNHLLERDPPKLESAVHPDFHEHGGVKS